MLHLFIADTYRIRKERLSLIAVLLLTGFAVLFAYLYRDGQADQVATLWATVLPLFFVTPAKIFLGEDLTTRTINHVLIKTQNRFKVFAYKWVRTLLTCWFFLVLALGLSALAHHLFTGEANYQVFATYGFYQLPLYTVIASLCAFIFAFFDRIYQSYLVYILIALLFDQLFSLMMGMLFQTDVFNPYLMFNQVSRVDITGNFFSQTSIVALLFTLIYAGVSYLIFKNREFK